MWSQRLRLSMYGFYKGILNVRTLLRKRVHTCGIKEIIPISPSIHTERKKDFLAH